MKQAIESYTIDPVTFISKTKQAGKKGSLFRCSYFCVLQGKELRVFSRFVFSSIIV